MAMKLMILGQKLMKLYHYFYNHLYPQVLQQPDFSIKLHPHAQHPTILPQAGLAKVKYLFAD